MTRSLATVIKNQLAGRKIKFTYLFEGQFESGTIYLTSFQRNLTHNGNTYTSLGGLIGVDGITDVLNFEAPQTTIYLNGLDSSAQSLVLQQEFCGNTAIVTIAFLDLETDEIIGTYEAFKGQMDGFTLSDSFDSQSMSLSIPLTFEFARFDDTKQRRTNPAEQRALYPDDAFFDSVPELALKTLNW